MKNKSLWLVVAFLSVSALLSGCGLTGSGRTVSTGVDYGYSMVSTPAPAEMAVINSQCTDGENIYISGMSGGGLPRCYKVLPSGNAEKLKVPGTVGYIYGLCYDDGLYMLCGDKPSSWKDAQGVRQGNELEEYNLSVILLDEGGNPIEETVLTGSELSDGAGFFALEKIGDKFFAVSSRRLVCFGSDGQELDCVSLDNDQFLYHFLRYGIR